MTPTPTSPPTCSPRSGRTSGCARRGRASFLLESVERGRLGRNSLIGAGSRLVSLRRGGGARRSRSSATSPTTTSASSSRRCRCPTDGPGLPESRFVVAETLVRFDHGAGIAEVLAGDAEEIAGAARGRHRVPASTSAARRARPLRRFPDASRYEEMVRSVPGAHRRGRRLPDRPLAARRAADVGLGARALPRAAARQPVAVPLPARARRARARRLLAGDARRVRGRPREPRTRSRARPSPARATPSGCSPPRRTAPST